MKAEPASADITGLVSDYKWRVNDKTGCRELVRRSDGFVADRIRLTPKEHRMETPNKPARRTRRIDPNRSYVGETFGKLTVVEELQKGPKGEVRQSAM